MEYMLTAKTNIVKTKSISFISSDQQLENISYNSAI